MSDTNVKCGVYDDVQVAQNLFLTNQNILLDMASLWRESAIPTVLTIAKLPSGGTATVTWEKITEAMVSINKYIPHYLFYISSSTSIRFFFPPKCARQRVTYVL